MEVKMSKPLETGAVESLVFDILNSTGHQVVFRSFKYVFSNQRLDLSKINKFYLFYDSKSDIKY